MPPPQPSAQVPDEERVEARSITHNTLFSLYAQMFSSVVTAGLLIFVARLLGPHEFGILSIAMSFVGLLLLPSDFGISQSASRYAAEHRDNRDEVAEVVASALRLKLYLALGATVALILLAAPIASAYNEPELVWPLRALALVLLGQNMMNLYGGVLIALGRSDGAFVIVMLKSVAEAVATIAAVLVVAGGTEAALGRGVGFAVGAAASFVIGARIVGRRAVGLGGHERTSTGRVARYAGAVFLIDAAFALFQQIDTLLIGAYLTTAAAGLFQAPIRLIEFFRYPSQAIANGVAPRLAGRDDEQRDVEPFWRGLRYTIVFQTLLIAPCAIWPGPIIELLLGSEYAESANALRVLTPFIFLLGIGTLLSIGINYLGEAGRRIPIAIGAVAINVVLDVILIPKMGIEGAAVGTDVAFAFYVAGHVWVCRRLIGFPVRAIARTTARSLVAAAAMAALLVAIGTGDVSIVATIGGLAAAGVVYAVAIVATRELPFSEVRWVLDRVRNA